METAEHVVSTVLSKACYAKSPQEATMVGVPGQEACQTSTTECQSTHWAVFAKIVCRMLDKFTASPRRGPYASQPRTWVRTTHMQAWQLQF